MNIFLPEQKKWQRDSFDYIIKNLKDKIITISACRLVGKSIFIEILSVYVSWLNSGVTMIVSPTINQSRKIYNDIIKMIQDTPLLLKKNDSLLMIKFSNGSEILLKSAEQKDGLRGYTISNLLIIDEAAYIADNIIYEILFPMCNVHRSSKILCSTPKFKQGVFFNSYTKGEEKGDVNYKTFNWARDYDLNDFLPDNIKELYRKELPKLTYKSEILGEFISGDGTVFPDFKKNISNYNLQKDRELFITIDWGTGSGADDTVLCYGQIDDFKLKISHFDAFNDKSPTITIDYILNVIKTKINDGFKQINLTVEKNSIGNIYYDMLYLAIDLFESNYNDENWRSPIEINCNTFITSNTSKKKAVELLELLFEQDKIYIPDDDKLKTLLSMFEATIDKTTNTVFYKGANNSHDDYVLALLFMVSKIYNEIK